MNNDDFRRILRGDTAFIEKIKLEREREELENAKVCPLMSRVSETGTLLEIKCIRDRCSLWRELPLFRNADDPAPQFIDIIPREHCALLWSLS